MEIITECMKPNEIKNILLKNLFLKEIYVLLHDDHYQIIAVDPIFSDMNMLEAHKIIYAPLTKYISANRIHSVSIKVFSPEEWNEKRLLFNI